MRVMFEKKLDDLRLKLSSLGSCVVAFSGGVDSALLVKVAFDVLRDRMLAVTANSPSVPSRDMDSARSFCKRHGIPHMIIDTNELENPTYAANPDNRCFYCKWELFSSLCRIAEERNMRFVVEGTNASEIKGHRPGHEAAKSNRNVSTPYVDLGISRDEIVGMARMLKLEVADRPSTACLASRIPTGVKIEPGILYNIDRAENFLISLGVKQVRVRHCGDIARIETDHDGFGICIRDRLKIADKICSLGWKYVTLDLAGYRTGGGR